MENFVAFTLNFIFTFPELELDILMVNRIQTQVQTDIEELYVSLKKVIPKINMAPSLTENLSEM